MSYAAASIESTIMSISRTAPKTWARVVDALVEVDDDEIAALRALPFASTLLDGASIRPVGLVGACLFDVDAAVAAAMKATVDKAVRDALDAAAAEAN